MDFSNAAQFLNGTNYAVWKVRMRTTLMAAGADVWNSVITGYSPPKKARTIAQKEAKKNNSMAMETILKGMTDSVKEKIGQHISAKDLWLNVEQLYSIEGQEVNTILSKTQHQIMLILKVCLILTYLYEKYAIMIFQIIIMKIKKTVF